MKTPIVFSFNDGYLVPACVCITSLLENANPETFYDIFILHSSSRLSDSSKSELLKLKTVFSNCDLTFVDVGDAFKGAFEVRNITIDAYYRLLIPKLIVGYEKIIYSDVDVIFLGDVSSILLIDTKGASVLGRVDTVPDEKYLQNLGLNSSEYINSGFLVFNCESKLSDESERCIENLVEKKYLYQDQDVINLFFKNKIFPLPLEYNYTFAERSKNVMLKPIVYHYTGAKPWDTLVAYGDVWWEYYRKSMFYKAEVYEEYNNKMFSDVNDVRLSYKFSKKTGLIFLIKLIAKVFKF